MRIRIVYLLFFLVVAACSFQRPEEVQEQLATPTGIPVTSTSTRVIPTTTNTPVPIPSPLPDTPTPTLEPIPQAIELISEDELLAASEERLLNDAMIDLKAEVYLSGGAGGGGSLCTLPQDWSLPYVAVDYGKESVYLCLLGFPENQEIRVEIYSPTGVLVSDLKFIVSDDSQVQIISAIEMPEGRIRAFQGFNIVDYNGSIYVDYPSDIGDSAQKFDELVILLNLWFPKIPQLVGNWKINASYGGTNMDSSFTISELESPAISAIPSEPFQPTYPGHSFCNEFASGDQILIIGTGFGPNQTITVGIYRGEDRRIVESADGSVRVLVHGEAVKIDTSGGFQILFRVEPDDLAGYYYVYPFDESGRDISETLAYDHLPCFIISGETNPVEYASWEACEDRYLSRLQIGDLAFVSADPPYANTVRAEPGRGETSVGKIQPLEKVEILDGPACADNWVWWKVRSLETDLMGWTSEGDQENYWLIPMK